MSPQNHADPSGDPAIAVERSRRMSRRSVLRGAAGAGAVGLAAATGAGAAVALTRQTTETASAATRHVTMAPMSRNAMAGPLVVYLRDTRTGVFDVFAGTGQVRIKDSALVAELLRAMR